MHTVKRSFYLNNYKILLQFDDETFKIIDLENEIWGPVFEPLKDVNFFKKVKAKGGTIVWPNEADFCPDVLYKMGKEIKNLKQPRRSLHHKRRNSNSSMSRKSQTRIVGKSR